MLGHILLKDAFGLRAIRLIEAENTAGATCLSNFGSSAFGPVEVIGIVKCQFEPIGR
jgi:hypothetical protein